MFKKSDVEKGQANLRLVEKSIDRSSARKAEILASIAQTESKINALDSALSETLCGDEALATLEAASRQTVTEKLQLQAWLDKQRAIAAMIDTEIATAKLTIPAIEEQILEAQHETCNADESTAEDDLWKAIKDKLPEYLAARRRRIESAKQLAACRGNSITHIPSDDEAWDSLGRTFLARQTVDISGKKAGAAGTLKTFEKSGHLTAEDRQALNTISRDRQVNPAAFLAECADIEERQRPVLPTYAHAADAVREYKERVAKAEDRAALVASQTWTDYLPVGALATGELQRSAQARYKEELAGSSAVLANQKKILESWQATLAQVSSKAA